MTMTGRNIVITGASSGVGLAASILLAEQGARVAMVCRDPKRGWFMRNEVAKYATHNPPILFLTDLSSQANVAGLASELSRTFDHIDVLINNAGAMFADREVTPEGVERTFALNHLAPFVLTQLVLDLLRAAPTGRILIATSEFHSGSLDFSNLQGERHYNWLSAYRHSKLCNILFTYELARRLAGTKITANCFSPGPTLTRLGDNMRGLPAVFPWLLKRIPSLLTLPERAAETPVYVASSPDLDGISGKFFLRGRETRTPRITRQVDVGERLWRMSEALYQNRPGCGRSHECGIRTTCCLDCDSAEAPQS
jgi:NAD(P)-dependent dehydrogenase (short-subunit alcohol dehydrogenase family)